MSGTTCPGCLGTGRDWVCLGTGFACPETKSGVCTRCRGSRRCDLCDAPYQLTAPGPGCETGPADRARRVLVIDDEEVILDLLVLWFADDPRCHSVVTASTADAAIGMLADETPDAIICDFQLGHVTSDAYLPGLRAAAPNACIVVYTCDPALAQLSGVLDRGADVVLDKVRVSLADVVEVAMQVPSVA